MIPKRIHYCWFGGGEMPEAAERCIQSWKKYCPDYEIIRWDESNFDLECNQYVIEAYQNKKWAFVSDVARLKIIYDYGGVYFDTDVEVIKPFDVLLDNYAFMGAESTGSVNTGLGFGSEAGNEVIKDILYEYEKSCFDAEKPTSCPVITTDLLKKKGYIPSSSIQKIDSLTIYPNEYFAPIDLTTRKLKVTENTYSIHQYLGSWISDKKRRDISLRVKCCKVFGNKLGLKVYGLASAVINEGIKHWLLRHLKEKRP